MIKEAIIKLSNKQDIGYNMAKEVMNEIMSGKASDIQKSAYLTALDFTFILIFANIIAFFAII